jgi:alpha 1,3-glucosidase
MYGLSERESSLLLSDTTQREPYRFFNIDYYAHQINDARGEYGSIPYITGHSKSNDGSLLWVNSADTWTDVIDQLDGTYLSNFVSESGHLEFFLFSSQSPKTQLENLATITGHAPMPPIEALGYHFSKYADVSADIMMQRDSDFESHGFPVDVYWMDILYSQDY